VNSKPLTLKQIVAVSGLTAFLVVILFGSLVAGTVIQRGDPKENNQGWKQFTVCHKENGKPNQTKHLPNRNTYEAHLAHGDSDGPCQEVAEQPTPTNTPVTPPPTPPLATNTPTPVSPTATNTPVPVIPLTNTPEPTEIPKVLHTATPTNVPNNVPLVESTPTEEWLFVPDLPEDDEYICDLCTAQESALYAEARWKNTLSDFMQAIMDGLVPEVVKFWKE
jgi:hypothetical protein